MIKRKNANSEEPIGLCSDGVSGNGQLESAAGVGRILLIDDNADVARAMQIACHIAGYVIQSANSPAEALSCLGNEKFDVILLDMNFTPGYTDGREGLALLADIQAIAPNTPVVVITAHSSVKIAVAAMQGGASDFVMKPWRNAEVVNKIESAIEKSQQLINDKSSEVAGYNVVSRILGESPAITRVRAMIERIAPTSASVSVSGLSGVGRSLVAAVLHAKGRVKSTPLTLDLEDHIAWDMLSEARPQILLHADRLDTIMQGRLVERLARDARVVAVLGSTADLIPTLRARIATFEIAVPALSERGNDSLILARHFARNAAIRQGRMVPRFTPAAEALLTRTMWPEEVRGLAFAVERAVILTDGDLIDVAAIMPPPIAKASVSSKFDLAEREKLIIAAALREHRHNVTHAAAALGLTRGALYRRMERYGL